MFKRKPKGFFFSLPSVSVDKTLMPVIERLSSSGYEICYYNTAAFQPKGDHSFDFRAYPDNYTGYDSSDLNEHTTYFNFGEMLLDSTSSLIEFLMAEAASEKPDFIIHSHLAVWGKLLALRLGVPQVTLFTTFVLDERIVLPHLHGADRSRTSTNPGNAIHFYRRYEEIHRQMGLTSRPSMWDIYVNRGDLNLCFTAEALQPGRESIGPEFHYMGYPFAFAGAADPADYERRQVYISMGTIFNSAPAVYNICIRVLSSLPYPAELVVGNKLSAADLSEAAAHIKICSFTDQVQALRRSLVFVSRGGMASIMEAIYTLTPLIVIPEIPEQQLSAKRIEELGIGVVIHPGELSEERLGDAISHILSHHAEYSARMALVRDGLPAEPAVELAFNHLRAFLDLRLDKSMAATIQQQGIWFHAMSHSVSYWNFIKVEHVRGRLDEERLSGALVGVCQRHESFRTNLDLIDGKLCQTVSARLDRSRFFVSRQLPPGTDMTEAAREGVVRMLAIEPDMSRDPLFRLELMSCGDDHYILFLLHHSIADGYSLQVIWKELMDLYNDPESLQGMPPARQYAAFLADQEQYLRSAKYEEAKTYWLKKLDLAPPPLSFNFFSLGEQTSIFHRDMAIPADLSGQLRSFALVNRVYLSSILLAAYQLMLYKYSGQARMVIGNVVSGRGFGANRYKGIVGHFANRLAHLFSFEGGKSFIDLLRSVQEEVARSFEHGDLPYEEIVRQMGDTRRNGKPLFSTAFNLIKDIGRQANFEGLAVCADGEFDEAHQYDSQYDVYLNVIDGGDALRCKLALRCGASWTGVIGLMLDSYLSILRHCLLYPDRLLQDIPLQGPEEEKLLVSVNNTGVVIPSVVSVMDLFYQSRGAIDQDAALNFGGRRFSYEELGQRVSQLATGLNLAGLKKGDRAGILMKRSQGIVEMMLAALQAGVVYVALDPAYPAERLAYICADSALDLVVTDIDEAIEIGGCRQMTYGVLLSSAVAGFRGVGHFAAGEDALAYILYTSGSTGRPKGVMIGHAALVNFIRHMTDLLPFRNSRVYSMTTYSFDIFFLESITALCGGAEVILASAEEQRDPMLAASRIRTGGANIMQVTPSRLRLLLDTDELVLENLEVLVVGGEPFPEDLFVRVRKRYSGRLFNMYGPTETTIWSTVKELGMMGPVTAGVPIADTKIYILGNDDRVLGPGIYGEVAIAGKGLSAGYWHQPEKTAAKFFQHPGLGMRLYRTGDIGRWHPAGELEIKGREDDQIKLRGYRIETGEIEYWLSQLGGLKKSVVLCIRGSGGDNLHAFYESPEPFLGREIRKFLKQYLPDYMIPESFQWMSRLPLTPNGKTDRLALQQAFMEEAGQKEEASSLSDMRDDKLVALWNEILESDEEDNDNFFDAGGHSLKALYLLELLEKKYGMRMSIQQFFKQPTLSHLLIHSRQNLHL